jgi:hypothetical protein
MEITVQPGDTSEYYRHHLITRYIIILFCVSHIVVLDTNIWYHKTNVVSEEISITIGSEYD